MYKAYQQQSSSSLLAITSKTCLINTSNSSTEIYPSSLSSNSFKTSATSSSLGVSTPISWATFIITVFNSSLSKYPLFFEFCLRIQRKCGFWKLEISFLFYPKNFQTNIFGTFFVIFANIGPPKCQKNPNIGLFRPKKYLKNG